MPQRLSERPKLAGNSIYPHSSAEFGIAQTDSALAYLRDDGTLNDFHTVEGALTFHN
jgi:hypothetical protein